MLYSDKLLFFFLSVLDQEPGNETEFLGKTAEFICITHNVSIESIHWHLNDSNVNDLPTSLQKDLDFYSSEVGGFNASFMTIKARAEYNETRVRCAIGDGHSVITTNATLYIQGNSTFI